VKHDSALLDAVTCVLILLDSTIRSNISLAAPIDFLLDKRDSFNADCQQRIIDNTPYYISVRQGWMDGLRSVFRALPSPDWN